MQTQLFICQIKILENQQKSSPESVLNENKPELIVKWQLVPSLCDEVRMKCDEDKNSGKYLLTGSIILLNKIKMKYFILVPVN